MNNRQCAQHPTHPCVYFCPDTSCRTSLCELCFSDHTPSHQAKIVKLNDIQTEIMSKIETKAQMKLGSLLKDKCQSICEKSFQDLTQQNSVDFDTEDLIDLVADTAIHKLFSQLADETNPKNKKDTEMIEEKKVNETQATTKKSGQRLFIAGGYNIETGNDFPEFKYWSDKELKALYGSDYIFPQVDSEVQAFYVKSQNKVVLSSRLYKVFCVKDLGNKSVPPTFFRIASGNTDFSAYNVLDFHGKIILLVTLKNKLLVYELQVPETQQEFEEEDPEEEEDEEDCEEDFDERDEFEDEYAGEDVWACAGYDKDPTQKVHKNIKATIHNLSIAKQFPLPDGFRIIGSDDKDQIAIGEDRTKVSIYKLTYEDRTFKLLCKHKIELSTYYSTVTIDDINNLVLVYRHPDLLVYKEENNKLSQLIEINGSKDRKLFGGYSYNKYNQMLIMDSQRLYKFSNGSFTHLKNLPKIDYPIMTRKGVLGKINRNEISFFPLNSLELDSSVQIPIPDPRPAFEVLRKKNILLNETAKKDTPRCVSINVLDDSEDELLIYVDADMSYGRRDSPQENDIILNNQFVYAYQY